MLAEEFRTGPGPRRTAGPRARLLDQLSRRADHRGQISAEAAAAVRAGRRDRRRGRSAVGEGVERLDGRRPADRRDSASAGLPSRSSFPPSARSRCRAERSFEEGSALLMTYATAIHALVDRGQAAGRADLAGARRGRRRRHCGGRNRQGARRAGHRGGFVGGEGRSRARGGRGRGARLSRRPFDGIGQKALSHCSRMRSGPPAPT